MRPPLSGANIAGIQRRDIFDPILRKLVSGACRWHDQHRQALAARAKIVRDGRIFASELGKAPERERWPFEIALPYGSAWLDATLNARPSPRYARNKQLVIQLCALVNQAGGKITLNEKAEVGKQRSLIDVLEALTPYLPLGFIPASLNTLRRWKESAAHPSRHGRQ